MTPQEFIEAIAAEKRRISVALVAAIVRPLARASIFGACGYLVFFRDQSGWLFALAAALSLLVR